jgi:hypothetical protein
MRFPLALLLSTLLVACGSSDTAYVQIQGSEHSLTLVRDKPYLWSEGWDLALVVSRMPECSRRHHLKRASDGSFRMDVFRAAENAWILRQGKRWYVADTTTCELQQFEEKPPEPGVPVGSFENKSGALRFVQLPDLGKTEPLPAGVSATE